MMLVDSSLQYSLHTTGHISECAHSHPHLIVLGPLVLHHVVSAVLKHLALLSVQSLISHLSVVVDRAADLLLVLTDALLQHGQRLGDDLQLRDDFVQGLSELFTGA